MTSAAAGKRAAGAPVYTPKGRTLPSPAKKQAHNSAQLPASMGEAVSAGETEPDEAAAAAADADGSDDSPMAPAAPIGAAQEPQGARFGSNSATRDLNLAFLLSALPLLLA